MSVRVRFAPSPTGPLHIGGVRTALYNFLFAKKSGGKFILRIEDTDRSRYIPDAEEYINSTLKWLNLLPDEGPSSGGEYGPYRQSERKSVYQDFAIKLIDSGNAYYAFDTAEELELMRTDLKVKGSEIQQYNYITRGGMKNSLSLSEEEINQWLEQPHVIRLKVPENEDISFKDLIRGEISFSTSNLDDKILIKSDGLPTYHMANVVDDYLMKITHVIRGEEWLPSTPIHVLLYNCFNWQKDMPQFVHLPLLLKPEGSGKLSKRDSDKHGFPIFPLDWTDHITKELSEGFKEKGFLPEALINFLALLGWNPGTEQEIFSVEELIKYFSIERISKAGIKFDIQKAEWFNKHYIREIEDSELTKILIDQAGNEGFKIKKEKADKIVSLFKERITYTKDLFSKSKIFFTVPVVYDEKVTRKKWTSENIEMLAEFKSKIDNIEDDLSGLSVKNILENITNKKNVSIGKIMQPLRVALTGEAGGPDLMEMISLLGKEEVRFRIDLALEKIPVKN